LSRNRSGGDNGEESEEGKVEGEESEQGEKGRARFKEETSGS
jgi:hypothetical protein